MANEEKMAFYKLFNIAYRVSIKEMFFYDRDVVAQYGRPTSGNKNIDRAVMNSWRDVIIPVCHKSDDNNSIIRFFGMGADIQFKNIRDIAVIYQDICEHLADWESYLTNDLHGQIDAPLDDLLALDQLKDALFPLSVVDDDLMRPAANKLTLRRTFGRRTSAFGKKLNDPSERIEEYSTTGSHIFRGTAINVPDNMTSDEASIHAQKETRAQGGRTRNFTEVFERHKARLEQ